MHEPEARLHARPRPPARHGPNGLQVLPVEGERDSHLYVSPPVSDRSARPLMVLLHGAGGHTRHGLGLLKPLVDRHGVILLAPASSTYTWDVVVDRYGEDVRRIDSASGTCSRATGSTPGASRSPVSRTAPRTRSRWG